MRTCRTRLQLGMELTAEVPRMSLELDDLDERAVGRKSAQVQAVLDESVPICVGDFVSVTMSLAHLWRAVDPRGESSFPEPARISAEAHRAAHIGYVLLGFHQRDDRIAALRREFAGVTVVESHHVAGELDDGRLHSKTDSEERHSRFA